MKIGARNILKGKVVKVYKDAANIETSIALPRGFPVTAVNTRQSDCEPGLQNDGDSCAIIKASSDITAVDRVKYVQC